MVYSAANLVNNIIADNRLDASSGAAIGSGVAVVGASPKLVHTTIGYNTGGDGSGIYVADITENNVTTYSNIVLTNTILVNQAVGIVVAAAAHRMMDRGMRRLFQHPAFRQRLFKHDNALEVSTPRGVEVIRHCVCAETKTPSYVRVRPH